MKHLLLFFTCAFILTSLPARADGSDPFFLQHYDNRNGLSNSAINYIYKDASNLLWIATWDGLNMYDGNSFHVFNYSKENDFKSIGSNVIQQVTEDKLGNIWITTIEGISRYEKHSGRFFNYFYNQYRRSPVSEQEYALTTDTSGTVYCFNQKTGLSWYDAAADSFRNSRIALQSSRITKISFDAMNRLWTLNSANTLNAYSTRNHAFTALPKSGEVKNVTAFFKTTNGFFYTTTGDKLWKLSPTSEAAEIMQLPHPVTAMTFYKGHYLLAWASKGYAVYDAQFHKDDFLQQETRQLQDIKITSWSLGSEDILWYGTDGNGIIKVYPKTKSFGTVATADNGMPYNRAVRAFCEVDNDLWVATKGSGIIAMKNFWTQENGSAKTYFSSPSALDNNSVYALTKGNDGLIYIGTDGKGISLFDQKDKKFYKWNSIHGYDRFPEFGSVYAISQDTDGAVWLGTSGYGLIHLKVNRDKTNALSVSFVERYTFNNSNTGPANDIIYALTDAGNDQLWVGCRYGGLSLLDKKTRRFKTFKAFTYDGSLSNNDVLSLFKDTRNRLWVGTSYGLNWLDENEVSKSAPQFKKLTTIEGLPNNTIHAIEQDSTGQVWVSTNKGLAKVDYDGNVSYYQQADGLQSNEFCDGAVWKDRSGNLFFGGTYGFNHFLPQSIRRSAWQPNLLLAGMLIGGKDSGENGFNVLDSNSRNTFNFTVNRRDNFFELDIKAVSFLNSEKCEYAYYLSGYDKSWHYGGTNGKITYSNLLPGSYKLKVKWSNGEGTWSQEISLLSLDVQQYFWLRWYAIAAYLLVLAVIGYIIYTYRKNKIAIRHQLEVEHLLREKDEAIHESRIGFFTNIAHELQTPLTLIMGSAERFMDKDIPVKDVKDKPYFLSIIHQQASRLTYLVHQLLEFRKGEAGFIKNDFHFMNVSELLENLAAPFLPISEKNQMEYEVNIAPGISGWMDKDKLEKIVFNLLSNAFKHSEKNEQVLFSATENIEQGKLEIMVSNSGTGLSKEALDKLFVQFYTTASAAAGSDKFGTGIGLAFTRQLVHLLKGDISAFSENERIIFKLVLPLNAASDQLPSAKAVSDKPSYLYQAITAQPEPFIMTSAVENNKQAIIENLVDDHRPNILVVEDDANIRFLLKDILKDEYIVHEATDGLKALEIMSKMIPDLLICDVMMPNMNGLELCNKIKNAPATCQVPVIMLSARGSEDHHMEGYEVGADAYIAKPFHTAHLKLRIRKLLEYRRRLLSIFSDDQQGDAIKDADLADEDKHFLLNIVKEIEDQIAEPALSALFLEKKFNMSKMQLYRKLKTITGMTPGEFIRHIRLKNAAALLLSTRLTVTEIFYRTGFNNQSYFFREFKKRYACAPNEYRENKTAV